VTVKARRRRLKIFLAVGLPIAIAGIGIAAWNDAGRQPVRDIELSVMVPESKQ